MRDVDERALKAKEKKAALGPDVDLSTFTAEPVKHGALSNLGQLSDEDRNQMVKAGIDAQEAGRSGSYIQMDTAAIFSRSKQEGLEVIPIKRALKECDWIHDYYWKLVSVDADKYTAKAQLELHDG
jgi:hypothetical protein